MVKTPSKCTACGNELTFRYRPMPEWNTEGDLCGSCYSQKLTEHYISPDRRGVTKR